MIQYVVRETPGETYQHLQHAGDFYVKKKCCAKYIAD